MGDVDHAWTYRGSPFDTERADSESFSDFIGFVYCIVNKETGQRYIGKKLIKSKRRLPPLKGKKRCRIVVKHTDWLKYWSSSEVLKAMIAETGKENLYREIIMLAKTKSQLNYAETATQILLDVLHAQDSAGNRLYINENIERVWYNKNTMPLDVITKQLAEFDATS